MIYQPGDLIKLIDENVKAKVLRVDGESLIVEDEFGFEVTYHISEVLPDADFDQEIAWEEEKREVKTEKDMLKELIERDFAQNQNNYSEIEPEKPIQSSKSHKKGLGTFVLDLHYGNLENYSQQLPVQFILNRQVNAAISGIEKAKSQGYDKVILIHGKGKGVLESKIKEWLDEHKFTYYDADFQRYKLGATEIEL